MASQNPQSALLDQNSRNSLILESSTNAGVIVRAKGDEATGRLLVDSASGSGTVTSVSVVTANGFAGSVANATTTPAITLSTTVTGVLKGNGTAISAAVAGTDYTSLAFKTIVVSGQSDVVADTPEDSVTFVAGSGMTITTNAGADTVTFASAGSALTVEEDGGPSVANVDTIVFDGATVTDDTGGQVTVTISAAGTPGGANTQLQYNNAGSFGGITGATTNGTVVTLTSALATTAFSPSSNDGAALGSGTASFSDLFLASGGLINWANGNATITHSSGLLTTSVPVTITGVATADGFAPTSSTATGNRMYLPAANTLGFAINGTGEVQLTATALSPVADGGNSLGTTALGWQNLFGNTGFVLNIENSDWVATHTAGILTVGTGDLRVTNAGTNAASVVTVGGTQTLTNKTLTSPTINTATLGGATQLAEGASIRLDQTLSADGTYSGTTIAGTAGATLAFGDLVYLAVADSRWELADASAVSTSGSVLIGFCVLAAAADGDPTVILLDGNIRADAAFPVLTVGAAAFISETAGDITNTAPTTTDSVTRVVGYGLTADSLLVRLSPDWITHV